MRLDSIAVQNFKRIKSVRLMLANVNILVGANSSGKSSIIQAIHLACCAIRQAPRIDKTKTSTINIDVLDYLPTDNYKMLGHKKDWGNTEGTPSTKVWMDFSEENEKAKSSCELRSARNAGISVKGAVSSELVDDLRRKSNFFSAYIPGISGIPNKEEKRSKKVILKACSYGDSNIYLRNVLRLLQERDESHDERNIDTLEEWLGRIIGPIKINVKHDEDEDLYINSTVIIGQESRPLELIGTGYIQLIQIFSYVLLFRPGILLIDEPDIHLHPTIQEKLVRVLSEVADEKSFRVLLTTHSPFVVRGAPITTKVYWVREGGIQSSNREEVELALGWGAFGKKIIIISEDKNLSFIKKIISQWPEIEQFVTYMPGMGYSNLPTPDQAEEIRNALGGIYKILVHRDRDSLTDGEKTKVSQQYTRRGVSAWITHYSDVEAYFCTSKFLEDFLGCSDIQAKEFRKTAYNRLKTETKEKFAKHRRAHNDELYPDGGSPENDDVWEQLKLPLNRASGKSVFRQLKNAVPSNAFSEGKILQHKIGVELASDLKKTLKKLLKS